MPLGGYCTACESWVWLNPHGECQKGHPASRMRDVQQLEPQSNRSGYLAFRNQDVALRPAARFRWWWRHSLWIAWTFTAGFLNWVSFVYVGIKARHVPWTLFGFAYLVPVILTVLAIGTPLFKAMVALQLVVAAISVAHALHIRPQYRALMFGDVPQAALRSPPKPPQLLPAAQRPALPSGLDEAAGEVLGSARGRVDALLAAAETITKPEVRDDVVNLCRTADRIIAELGDQPRKLDAARGFLTYYLDAAQRIVEGYTYLRHSGSSSREIEQTVARAETSLHIVQEAFDRQLANVLADRALDLDSELELLERTVKSETMYSNTGDLE